MGLADQIGEALEMESNGELLRLRKQRDSYANQNVRLQTKLDELEKALSFVDLVDGLSVKPPMWLAPAKPKSHAATLVVMLSDTHFDEVVNPEEMEGLNAYNREIAMMRLEKWTQNVIKMARHYLSGVNYDGVVLILGGDIFSGDIHEELALTNEDTMIGSLLFWAEQVSAAVELLATEFKKCHVVSVVGNHGRTTRKPRMKQRVKTNFDWLLLSLNLLMRSYRFMTTGI
jgi:predicted MPP superfamily phosphohydrolase